MKTKYTAPEMEVIAFESEDIITTSLADPEENGLPVIDITE